jgi:hypothetical protein
MSIRSVLVASGCVLALALAGCSTSISGSAEAALTPSVITAVDDTAGDLALPTTSGDLALPTDAASNPIDPGDLLGGLGGMTGPDGKPMDPESLGELLGSLGGAEGLGDLGGLSGALSPECLSIAGATMALGFLMIGPMMGQPLSQSDLDEALSGLTDVPPELQGPVATLRDAAQGAVGASPAEASALFSSPEVNDAMDTLSKYLDAHCGGQ